MGYTLGMTVSPVEGTNIASYRSQVKHKIPTTAEAGFTTFRATPRQ
jgi:long-chain fatty acid transport protein